MHVEERAEKEEESIDDDIKDGERITGHRQGREAPRRKREEKEEGTDEKEKGKGRGRRGAAENTRQYITQKENEQIPREANKDETQRETRDKERDTRKQTDNAGVSKQPLNPRHNPRNLFKLSLADGKTFSCFVTPINSRTIWRLMARAVGHGRGKECEMYYHPDTAVVYIFQIYGSPTK